MGGESERSHTDTEHLGPGSQERVENRGEGVLGADPGFGFGLAEFEVSIKFPFFPNLSLPIRSGR